MSSHVLKKDQVDAKPVTATGDTDALVAGLHRRIASERVQMKSPAEDEDDAPASASHVLRSAQVEGSVQTVQIPTLDLEPDFPLPDDRKPERPPEPAPSPEEDALREEVADEWEARMEEAVREAREDGHAEGYKAGYDEGYAAAQNELQSNFQDRVATLTEDADQLSALWSDFIEQSQPYLLQLMIDVAEALLDAPLPESVQGASARAIAEAVEELAGDPPLAIKLHPVDYQRLQETGMIGQLNANHEQLRWNPDPALDEGDWSVESPVSMMRHFKDELIRTLRTRVGSLQDAPPDTPPPSASLPE